LAAAVDQSDSTMNAALDRVVAILRAQTNTLPGDPDPPAVDDVRRLQRMWSYTREAICRNVGDPPRYARARARCYAEQSGRRTADLAHMLEVIGR
jgi:hypothetical protein